jgi:hypothetical protein
MADVKIIVEIEEACVWEAYKQSLTSRLLTYFSNCSETEGVDASAVAEDLLMNGVKTIREARDRAFELLKG